MDLGLVGRSFAIIQIDINPVRRTADGIEIESTLCDHNCTVHVNGQPTGGGYTCPAAISLNPGVGARDVAPAGLLIDGLLRTMDGIRDAQRRFLAEDLPGYLDDEGVPAALRRELTTALGSTAQVVNLFGGSPELHPGCLDVISALHAHDVQVHLTTTGRRIIREPAFREAIAADPPDLLALSLDDIESVAALENLFQLDDAELATAWRRTPAAFGQRRKAIEAVQIMRLESMPPLLFNIVMHPRNLAELPGFLDLLTRRAPGALVNPYPVQTAFLGERGVFDAAGLDRLAALADLMIGVHLDRHEGGRPRWNLVPRLTYWLLIRSIATADVPARVRADRIGGSSTWRCYTRRGAGRCVQIGSAQAGKFPPDSPVAGGHPGCFWNASTITEDRQFWTMTGAEMGDWILDGRQRRAGTAADPCGGCLFPRMTLDGVGLEFGLGPDLVTGYRAERARYLGY